LGAPREAEKCHTFLEKHFLLHGAGLLWAPLRSGFFLRLKKAEKKS
jgi:hypothetical protein